MDEEKLYSLTIELLKRLKEDGYNTVNLTWRNNRIYVHLENDLGTSVIVDLLDYLDMCIGD